VVVVVVVVVAVGVIMYAKRMDLGVMMVAMVVMLAMVTVFVEYRSSMLK
jgi:Zn-dependent membrane protease YugP